MVGAAACGRRKGGLRHGSSMGEGGRDGLRWGRDFHFGGGGDNALGNGNDSMRFS